MPVVVGLEQDVGELLVRGLGEELPAELRDGREAHGTEHPVRVHVADARVDVVAPPPHLLVRARVDAVLLGPATNHGVEADVGLLDALEHPHVGAVGLVDAPRRPVPPALGDPPLEEVGRLDGVVVDADQDQVLCAHGGESTTAAGGRLRSHRRC
jgi:hypothetical protein